MILQCDSYMRLLRDNIAQEASGGETDFNMDTPASDDDKTYAAMGVAKTISTVSDHLVSKTQAHSHGNLDHFIIGQVKGNSLSGRGDCCSLHHVHFGE